MAITKANAEAAIKALRTCGAGDMFDKIRGNQHSMEKHFSKGSAQAAAGSEGYPQGYFKRLQVKQFSSSQDLNRDSLRDKTKKSALAAVGAKKAAEFGRKLRGRTISVPEKSAASKDDILGLVTSLASSDNCRLLENDREPNTRFMLVAPIPDGFYGRAIDAAGGKSKDCGHAVLIINAATASNPQIVTIFPANDEYVGRRAPLT